MVAPISLNSIDVQPDVGVALHSSTPSSLSSHRIAVLSAKNVQWLGSHRPFGKLESLADRIAADSAIRSDPSPDSAVTPSVVLPWFLYDGSHVDRFSRYFHGGGVLDQRLLPPHPVYSLRSETGRDLMANNLDGYVSDDDCSYQRVWSGFQLAPSIRRLINYPSYSFWHPLPGLRSHPVARAQIRIPNMTRWFHQLQSDVPTDDEEPCYQRPPDIPYGAQRLRPIRLSCYEGNAQLEWFLGLCACRRSGDAWSQSIYDQEVDQQMREIKDLLSTVRNDDWGRQFSKAFTLSPSGRGLLTMAAIRNAVLGCTSEAGYRYRSTIFHRIKRQRGMPVGWRYNPIHRKSHGALSTFADDVPVYPSHEFLYNSMVWRKERARLAGHLRRLSQLMCSVEWTDTVCNVLDGYHSRDFPRSLDPGLVELNIRRMMGDAAFSASETALLNRQLNRWETSVFRVHIWWDAHHFSHYGCPLLALAA